MSADIELGTTGLLATKLQAAASWQTLRLTHCTAALYRQTLRPTHCTAPVYWQHSRSLSVDHFYADLTVFAARTALDRRAPDCVTMDWAGMGCRVAVIQTEQNE